MNQIDQDPRDYRADPIKGEPVFVRGGVDRVVYAAGIFFILGLAAIVFVAIFGPAATWFADTVTDLIF